jgi:hypothetical protein
VDFLRTGYSVGMRFFNDAPDDVRRVDWYKADPKAKMMPFATSFASLNYDVKDEPYQPAIGEEYGGRKWRNYSPPYPCPKCGLCGTEEQWQRGASIDDPEPETWPNSPVPKCCCPPPPIGLGGIAYGGSVEQGKPLGGGIAYGGSVGVSGPAYGGLAWSGGYRGGFVAHSGVAYGGRCIVCLVARGGEALGGVVSTGSIPVYEVPTGDCGCGSTVSGQECSCLQ